MVVLATTIALAPVLASGAPPAAASKGRTATPHVKAEKVAKFSFAGLQKTSGVTVHPSAPPHQPMNKTLRHTSAASVPHVPGTAIGSGTGGAPGFTGLDAAQQLAAGTGAYAGSQLDSSPPDQGLCVGQGDIVETINLAVRVYSTDGTPLTPAVPLNQFVGAAPTTTAGGAPFGPFLSDPKCYYDPDTGHWFLTVLAIAIDPTTGAFGNSAWQYVAVSQGPDPTAGSWTIYSFSTTDDGSDGTPNDAGCPCFGDQPLIGADANGFYVSTNEYSITGPEYNGAQLYLMSKQGLETGANTTVTHLQPGQDSTIISALGGVPYSVQPATSPDGTYDSAAGGTEYFESTLDFGTGPALGTRADNIAVWALANTSSLSSPVPSVSLSETVVPSELYAQPPNAAQAPGTLITDKHLPVIEANDDRLMQVVYAGGELWSGANTAVTTQQGPTLAGIAWFVTTPLDSTGTVSATMAGQGYLSVNKEDVYYPSIGVTPAGKAVMVFTLSGPDYHPSAAWAPLSVSSGAGPIYIAAAGTNAADDYSVLKLYQGDGASTRWGDYSAAVSDPSGTVWMATEYIAGGERTALANWSTYVSHVTP
jgi:hypothetical protein